MCESLVQHQRMITQAKQAQGVKNMKITYIRAITL